MAEAALSKSLDDIIAEQRQKATVKKEKQTSRRGNKAPPAKPAPSARNRGGRGGPQDAPGRVLTVSINRATGITKRVQAPGGRRGRPAQVEDPQLRNPEIRLQALEGAGKWGHDMFAKTEGRTAADPRFPSALGTKLYITNLHYDVTSADIKELFSTCGEVIRHGIIFEPVSGRSKEQGFVIYQQRQQAEQALQRYNGVALDGKEMQIELVPQKTSGAGQPGGRTLSSGIVITGEKGGSRGVGGGHAFQQAGGPRAGQPRGRGNVRSRVVINADSMQE